MDTIKRLLQDNDLPTACLKEVLVAHAKSKQWLAERLGTDDSWRLSYQLNSTLENRPWARDMLSRAVRLDPTYRLLDLGYVWKGENKLRVSKLFTDIWENFVEVYGTYTFIGDWRLDKIVADRGLDGALTVFLCHYGDYVKNGRVGWLSLNPYDFFTMGDYAHTDFRTCLSVEGGEYFNTVLHYLFSPNVLLSYITNTGSSKKIGRSVMYVSNNIVATSRHYGSYYDADALFFRDVVQEKIGGAFRVIGSIDEGVRNYSTGYVDTGYGKLSVNAEVFEKIDIYNGLCLECGGEADGQSGGICDGCGGDHCCACGDRLGCDDGRSYGSDIYCDECFSERYFYCRECGEAYHVDDENTFEGRSYCGSCFDDLFSYCDNCGETVRSSNMEKLANGDYACCDCALTCDECGERFLELNNGLCDSCLDDKQSEVEREANNAIA